MNDNYIEGIFVKKAVQSKGIGKQLLNHAKEGKSTLRLSVYQKNKKAIQFYLGEEFVIQPENTDNNTDDIHRYGKRRNHCTIRLVCVFYSDRGIGI